MAGAAGRHRGSHGAGGVGTIGIYKLPCVNPLEPGWVSGGLPVRVVVQSTGRAWIVRVFQAGAAASGSMAGDEDGGVRE